jgi:gluconate 2-dehydrogenase gamma chain
LQPRCDSPSTWTMDRPFERREGRRNLSEQADPKRGSGVPTSRREFLAATGSAFGGLWLSLHWRAVEAAAHEAHSAATATVPPTFKWLTAAEAADTEALASCIVPSGAAPTVSPGAREAHVVVFVDRALSSFFAEQATEFRSGLDEVQKKFASTHGGKTFAAASVEEQNAFMHSIDETAFFTQLRFLTVVGLLASPSYGGNYGGAGWTVMGFVDQHAFAPPFGYYDRDYAGFKPYANTPAAGAKS